MNFPNQSSLTPLIHPIDSRVLGGKMKMLIQCWHCAWLELMMSGVNIGGSRIEWPLIPRTFNRTRLHELKGSRKGVWSITVQANWRITFRFLGEDIELINYEDYH